MKTHPEYQYLKLLDECLHEGEFRKGRNGGTHGLFGRQIRFNLADGFPLLTTKKVNFHAIVVELLWFLRGDTNTSFLHDHGVHIWDEWADAKGDLGPVYGKQWRRWESLRRTVTSDGGRNPTMWVVDKLDQIAAVLKSLRDDPYGRRHIVTAWNPGEIDNMALPPCHCLFQFHVANGKLSCQLYQRSADIFLGVPFNIASYALLTHLIAEVVGLQVGEFVHTFGDVHLYDNHVEQAAHQLSREPTAFPTLILPKIDSLFGINPNHIGLGCYEPWPAIPAPVSK